MFGKVISIVSGALVFLLLKYSSMPRNSDGLEFLGFVLSSEITRKGDRYNQVEQLIVNVSSFVPESEFDDIFTCLA